MNIATEDSNNVNRLVASIGVCAIIACAFAPVRAADMAAAKQNYDDACVKCHGATGNGNGPGAASLHKRPRDFTDCAVMSKLSDDTLFNVIKNGGAPAGLDKEMAPFGESFEDGEIHDLVAYVRTFCKK